MSDQPRADISVFGAIRNRSNARMETIQSPISVVNECSRAFLGGMMSVFTFGCVPLDNDVDSSTNEKLFNFPKSDAEAIASDWQKVVQT